MKVLPVLLSDSYKQFHVFMYPKGMTKLYSNGTPRSFKHLGCERAVFFGLQYYIKEYLIDQWNTLFFDQELELVLSQYKRFHKHFSFVDIDTEHIEKLWKLGYLPITIKALPEGARVKEKVPFYTITNTHDDHAWLVNFLETQMSTVIWDLCVVATKGDMARRLLDKWAIKTTGSTDGVQWQGHDFSMRGRSSVETCFNQAAWLLSFTGTDTIPAVLMLEEYYRANMETELIGSSVPASEHSIEMVWYDYENDSEQAYFSHLLDTFKTGIISVVSDGKDLWKILTKLLPENKDRIMERDGKLVIRPDSGNPSDIICGTLDKYTDLSGWFPENSPVTVPEYFEEQLLEEVNKLTPHGLRGPNEYEQTYIIRGELFKAKIHNISWNRHDKMYYYIDMWDKAKITVERVEITPADKGVIELLWEVFGGTVNELGYKVLDSHIGAIYGDSIDIKMADDICSRLAKKKFVSIYPVFGFGSYFMNYNTRDSIGFAVKSTYCEVIPEGGYFPVGKEIFKDPVTDNGVKKSAKGLLAVFQDLDGEYYLEDQVNWETEQMGELKPVFMDGHLVVDHSLSEIRNRLLQVK